MLDNWIYYFQNEWTADIVPFYPVIYAVVALAAVWYGVKKTSAIGLLLGTLMVVFGLVYILKIGLVNSFT